MHYRTLGMALALSVVATTTVAYDLTETFSIGGILAGVLQCQDLSQQPTDATDNASTCKGAVPVQPELSWRPSDADEVFIKFGFAAGNALNADTSLFLAPWAASLEDDVKDINGRNRDYLLTAWYKHTFSFNETRVLGVTFGIIDGTDYLDENAYANDEYTQFMNEALVIGPGFFTPSFDLGGALEWASGRWSLRGVYMNVGENDEGKNTDYYAVQLGYHPKTKTPLRAGNYRVLMFATSDDFRNPEDDSKETRSGLILSFDQQLSDVVGGWIRFGWQNDDAAVDYNSIYSGGIDIKGTRWARANDNIGLGYGYLPGGSTDIDRAQVFEGYYRFAVNEVLGITGDVQYQNGELQDGDKAKGWVFSVRATAEF